MWLNASSNIHVASVNVDDKTTYLKQMLVVQVTGCSTICLFSQKDVKITDSVLLIVCGQLTPATKTWVIRLKTKGEDSLKLRVAGLDDNPVDSIVVYLTVDLFWYMIRNLNYEIHEKHVDFVDALQSESV